MSPGYARARSYAAVRSPRLSVSTVMDELARTHLQALVSDTRPELRPLRRRARNLSDLHRRCLHGNVVQ